MLKHKCNLQCDCRVCNCCVGYCDFLKEKEDSRKRWQNFQAPGGPEEPAFCHDCSFTFVQGETVKVNLDQGRMLCLTCHANERKLKMSDPSISGPHKKARAKAELALAKGDTAINYRGVSFTVVDHDRGWTYHIGNQELGSLEEVFNAIDATKKKKKTKTKKTT